MHSSQLPLTDRQQAIYDYIAKYQLEQGYSPKITEIAEAFGIKSVNGVIKHLQALEKKGWIQRDNTPRGIEMLESVKNQQNTSVWNVPIYGAIPAGTPQNLDEFIEGYQSVDVSMLSRPQDAFALIVKGESMIKAGIFEGDVVIAERREPKFGDIVVALVDGENTLKRYMKDAQGRTYLKAENDSFADIYPEEDLSLQGVAVYIIRRL